MWTRDLIFYGGLTILATTAVGLVAVWVGLGRPHWFVRLAALGGLLGLGLLVPAYDLVVVFLLQSVLVVVPLWLLRRRALPVRANDRDAVEGAGRSLRSRWQFSLLDLLLAGVVVAALAALLANMPADAWGVFGYYHGLAAAFLAAVSTLVAAWATLGRRFLWLRLILLLLLPIPGLVATWFKFRGVMDMLPLVWFLVLPSSLVMACWLALLWASGYRGIGKRGAASSAAATTGPARRRTVVTWLARAGLVLLSLGILAPLGVVFYLLVNPMPIPETSLPEENGYGALVEAGELFQRVGVPDADSATLNQLRAFVTQHRQVLDKARDALNRPCQVPVEYSMPYLTDHIDDIQAVRSLRWAFLIEGRLAEKEGRAGEAAQAYLTVIRLGHATGRGGQSIDALTGWSLEELGGTALYGSRDRLTPEECGRLVAELASLDAHREPLDDVLLRDRAWDDHGFDDMGCVWFGRLHRIKEDLFPLLSASIRHAAKRQQATARLLICELGIRTYHSEHGRPPHRLADLVPDYLPAVPQDPFGDGPLVYRRNGQHYLLYSVGPDGRDDGGLRVEPYFGTPGDLFLD